MKRNSFAYRHIGPKAVDVDQMLTTIGIDSIDTLIDQTVPVYHSLCGGNGSGSRNDGSRVCSTHHRLRRNEQCVQNVHWNGVPQYGTSRCYSAEYFRKSRMVYGLYALPSGNRSRSFRSFNELPNYGG